MEKTGVVVTPGQAFGVHGTRYVRLALVQDIEDIQKAAERIKNLKFLSKVQKFALFFRIRVYEV